MASTSAAAAFSGASSSDAAALPFQKFDVFISFRGEDTRDNFTSHLHAALCRHGIETFIDYQLEKGDEVWPSLVEAIQKSSVFLIIFSENYASSTWCLNELIEIMECKKKGDRDVIPVFLRIDPSHVRKQTGSYETAFSKHEQDSKHSDKTHKWREALFQAANISGFDSRGRTESHMIDDIIKSILQKLINNYPNELRGHFILDENYTQIKSSLRIGSKEVRIIGLWGMGGIGKTTIAQVIFHNICSQYECTCFLADVREQSKKNGLNYICGRLLSELLKEDLHIDTPKVIPSIVMNRLRRKKVFIVLDDVHSSEIINNLIGVGRDWLGAGSKVIVTTRDKHVLKNGGVDEVHEVKGMNFENSLQLFSLYAFKKMDPEKGYEELSERAVAYAKGVPLALKVLGSFLYSKSENEWDSALRKLEKIPIVDIQEVLMMSYNELDDTEKNIFLDIACVFKGQKRDQVLRILNGCGFFADIGIKNLLDKALITIDHHNCIIMHDLIQGVGHEIIRCESINNPGQRSRLWDFEEVYDVLKNNRGTNVVQTICINVRQDTGHLHLSSHAFTNMQNLRLLIVDNYGKMEYVHAPRDLKLPDNLIYIMWGRFPLKSIPLNCWKKLVDISMQHSNVKKLWNGAADLPNLKRIDLFGSKLEECPNVSGAPSLESLNLSNCRRLCHVHPSVFSLSKLNLLGVGRCMALKSLCGDVRSSMENFVALECISLGDEYVTMPDNRGKAVLRLGNSSLNKMLSSILHLRNVALLFFPICESLINLPETFTAKHVVLTKCLKDKHDTWIALRTAFFGPGFQNVKWLSFMCSETLFEIPYNICCLSSLVCLSIQASDVISLPESIKDLPCLKYLYAFRCSQLQSVPALPQSIQVFETHACPSLNKVLSVMREPFGIQKRTFLLPNCKNLDPDSFHSILKDAIVSIELGAKLPSAGVLEDDEDEEDLPQIPAMSRMTKSGMICYLVPDITGKVGDWFHFCSTQALISIELPPDSKFLGFIFYLVLSKSVLLPYGLGASYGCECLLEKSSGERVHVKSFFGSTEMEMVENLSNHVFLWYDAQCCKEIIEATKERKVSNEGATTYNPKLTFKFFAQIEYDKKEGMIEECGIHWIYPLEDHVVEEEGVYEFKSNIENHEIEVCAV